MSIDFYFPQYKIAIECQGEQHFFPTNMKDKKNMFLKKKNFYVITVVQKNQEIKAKTAGRQSLAVSFIYVQLLSFLPYQTMNLA